MILVVTFEKWSSENQLPSPDPIQEMNWQCYSWGLAYLSHYRADREIRHMYFVDLFWQDALNRIALVVSIYLRNMKKRLISSTHKISPSWCSPSSQTKATCAPGRKFFSIPVTYAELLRLVNYLSANRSLCINFKVIPSKNHLNPITGVKFYCNADSCYSHQIKLVSDCHKDTKELV